MILGPEQGIFCGVTSVRLSSSGNYLNTAGKEFILSRFKIDLKKSLYFLVVSIRPADESDIAIATLVC